MADVTLASVSTNLTELSNKVAQTPAKSSPEREPLKSNQGNFPQTCFRDMMTSLSMPGMKFVGEKGRLWLHTYLWIIIHSVALLVSYVLIKEEYDKWQKSPVVKTISNNLTYMNEIPFPAVTVCVPGFVSDGYDYLGSIQKCISCNTTYSCDDYFNETCSYEEKASLAIASLICPGSMTPPWILFRNEVNATIGGEGFSMYSKNVFPHRKVEMKHIKVGDKGFYVDILLLSEMYGLDGNHHTNFVSSFGLCFTMNGLGEKDIFTENTIVSSVHEEYFVQSWEGRYKGKNLTLEDMIYFNGSLKTIPAYISENYKIMISIENYEPAVPCGYEGSDPMNAVIAIHNPVNVPFRFNRDFGLKIGEGKEIRVIPEIVITEEGLKYYTPEVRSCFYSYERDLAMFKHYSENNCKTECLANCSLQHCGCIPYYLPRHNSSVRVCIPDCLEDFPCDYKACNCLPDCYSLSYDFEIVKESEDIENGRLTMCYKTSGFYATVRVSLTNMAQFMAYCLGIVGVFNGFSVMVIFEIFYFVTFRLWSSLKSYFQ